MSVRYLPLLNADEYGEIQRLMAGRLPASFETWQGDIEAKRELLEGIDEQCALVPVSLADLVEYRRAHGSRGLLDIDAAAQALGKQQVG